MKKWKMFLMVLFVVGLVGCDIDNVNVDDKTPTDFSTFSQIITINGYTYYSMTHKIAPTPDTIKRCLREVMAEDKLK